VLDQFIEVVTYEADIDEITGREVYPLWVFYVFTAAALVAAFGVLAML
jgi:hypothetical protein